ncbi:MAG: TetR family transcriptional regulator C-terminal domain-containing protein [Clostridia bacterium]|nr:TetR family transcriptional regulator C-terminal domain-containing protein [Clostridia bacterium]
MFTEELPQEADLDYSAGSKRLELKLGHILYHLKAHRSELKGILGGDSGALFMRYFKEYLRDLFGRYMDDFSVSVPSDYLLNHLVGSFAETVTWWITGKTAYTPEEVAGFFMAVIKAS